MGRLFEKIREAIHDGRYLVSWHADERCEERAVSAWQLAAGIDLGTLLHERPHSKPNATVVIQQSLADGTEVECVWAWLPLSGRAMLVTVYFPRRGRP